MIDSTALISGDDFPNIHLNEIMYIRIGLIKDYAHTDLFRRWFPNHPNTVEYGSTLLAIEGLERGEVDMVMTSNHELLIMSNYLERAGYKSNFVFNNILRVAFGYNINEAVLLSIIDKALHLIDTETISNRWLRQTYDYRAKVAEAQRPWLIGATVLSLALLAAILFMFIGVLGARKRLTKLVAEKTSTLTAILDTTPDLIFFFFFNSLTTECNKASEMYFNTPKEKIIGKPDPQTLNWTHEMQKQSIAADEKVMNERHVVVVEEYIQSSIGEQRLFETIKSPLIQEGKVVGLVGMARDITQRKAAEEEARSASEAKTRFIAAMSHELRTPMNSIIGFSELALNDQLPNETKDYLNKIMINSEWLLQIINDILDISKIESGKMDMERIPFDLHELFIACRTIILPKAGEKDITLYFYTEPSIGRKMLGDPLRLRQVLLNLLSNAVKFTGKGGIVKISANVKGFLNDKITIIFEVKDSGIGMTDEQIVKITQQFMQADTATTRKYGGTGLGLTISKNIIEILGGRLMVESTLGVGSKFSFDVTFDTVEYDENALEPGYGDTPADRPHFSGEVLICEDNLMNQQVLNEHLEKVGLKTDVAENGREGFNMVKRRQTKGLKPYDLIFMDINMPVMDGIEASTLIQALNTGTPIVAMTANVMTHDRELYRECGMKGCVGKPFRVQELWDCLLIYFTPEKWERKDEEENKEQNEKFRSSLIATFVKDNRNRYIEIVEALDCGDIKSANRLAHTMKSNAGQLGKTDLQKACADIEHLLKDGENLVTAEHLAVLETRLKAVIDEFTPLVKEPEPPPEVKSLDEQEAREILAQVKPLLERGSPDCLKYTDKLRGIPGSGEPLVRILIQQMEDLDFDLALKTLGEVMNSEKRKVKN
jgi:PAS domain S-box-containing protein